MEACTDQLNPQINQLSAQPNTILFRGKHQHLETQQCDNHNDQYTTKNSRQMMNPGSLIRSKRYQ